MEQVPALLFQVAQGLGLAACAGMRAFLPLFVVGVAGRLEWIRLSDSFEWVASWPAILVFGVAVGVEIVADKVPWVDNVLDMVQFGIKPVAGTLVVASLMVDLTPLQATVLGIVVGGTVADLVHLAKTKLRLVSSATTAGAGNPVISVAEDGVSLAGSLMAIFLPLLLLLLIVVGVLVFWLGLRSLRRRSDEESAPAGARHTPVGSQR